MADNFNTQAKISADVAQFNKAMDAAISDTLAFGDALGLTGKQIAGLEKSLKSVQDRGRGYAGATREGTTAQVNANDAVRRGAQDQKALGNSLRDNEGNLTRTRYALFDVASSYAAISAAALGAVTATGLVATQYESAFTAVERTTLDTAGNVSASIGDTKDALLDLSEAIPVSFEEITRIASLGAQLGIAEKDLTAFTDVVSKFAATTNVSVDEAAIAFGNLGQVTGVSAADYDKLGSAIALVGVNSIATEKEILGVAREVATSATRAGFAADEVVGLAGALASLRVPPERARGSLSTYFGTLNRAVAEGGADLENFATVVGVTASELEGMVRAGEGEDIFRGFLEGLSQLNNVDVTRALEELGLAQLRVEDTFGRLAAGTELYDKTLSDANQGFNEATFLNDAFSVVLDDVASQFQLLLNSVGRFLSVAGEPMLQFLRVALPLLTEGVVNLTAFAESADGQKFLGFVGFLATAIGLIAGLRAAMALATASTFALVTATQFLSGTGVIANLRAMAGAMAGIGGSAASSAGGVALLSGALRGLARATVVLGLIAIALDIVFNEARETTAVIYGLRDAVGSLSSATFDMSNNWQVAWANNAQSVRNMFPLLGGLIDVLDSVAKFAGRVFENMRIGQQAFLGFDDGRGFNSDPAVTGRGNRVTRGKPGVSLRDPKPPKMPDFDFPTPEALDFADALGGPGPSVAQGAKDATKEVRTLEDYASDLRKVFDRSFSIQFASQLSADAVADSWDTLTSRINDARAAIDGLVANRNVKEYFLSVANAYGDELRAGVLRAELAEINKEIGETQADASTELNGNSKAARNNRKALTDLSRGYDTYITDLAASGADQATLNRAVDQSEREFLAQAQALGFSRAQLEPYIQRFRDLTTVINTVPRNITVDADTNPALQALNEFIAQANASKATVGVGAGGGDGYAAGRAAGEAYGRGWVEGTSRFRRLQTNQDNSVPGGRTYQYYGPGGAISPKFFAEGGYTGRGGKYDPAGIVHKGEYVVPKSQVNQSTGLPYANALGNLASGTRGSSNGGYANGGMVSGRGMPDTMRVELSAYDRKLLAAAGNVQLRLDGRVVAGATNGANVLNAQRGTN